MSRIEDLIAELCPDGVELKAMGEVGSFVRGSGLQKKDFVEEGFPCIHYGQIYTYYGTVATETKSFVTPELAAGLKQAQPGDLVMTTTSENVVDVCSAVAWLGDSPIAIGGHSCVYKSSLDPKFVAYFLQTEQFEIQKRRFVSGTKVKDIKVSDIGRIMIPVPPLAVQHEISGVLEKMEELRAELEAELEARTRQYEYYRQTRLWGPSLSADVRMLGDLVQMSSGRFIAASEIAKTPNPDHLVPCYGGGGLRGYVGKASHHGEHVLIGRQGALCGNVKRASGEFYATEHAVVVTTGPDVDTAWVFHALTAMNLNQYASKSAQPGLAVGTLRGLSVVTPGLAEQRRVGAILDKFDVMVNDLSSGLPAEIAARRKQYEYYRDKLLTFEEKTA